MFLVAVDKRCFDKIHKDGKKFLSLIQREILNWVDSKKETIVKIIKEKNSTTEQKAKNNEEFEYYQNLLVKRAEVKLNRIAMIMENQHEDLANSIKVEYDAVYDLSQAKEIDYK